MHFKSYFSLLFLLTLTPLFALAQTHQSPDELLNEGKQRYGIEKGEIKYEFSGKASGTEMVRFDQFGWLESRTTDKQTSMFGMSSEQKTLSILKGNFQAMHNLGSQYASITTERFINAALQASSPAMQVLFGEEVVKRKDAKQVGSEEILGRRCKVYEVAYENSKVWVWEGIVLKSEKTILDDKITMEATLVNEDWEADASAFELPAGLNVQGMSW